MPSRPENGRESRRREHKNCISRNYLIEITDKFHLDSLNNAKKKRNTIRESIWNTKSKKFNHVNEMNREIGVGAWYSASNN